MEDRIIDLEEALGNLSGDVPLLQEILDTFLGSAAGRVRKLEESLAKDDLATVRSQALALAEEAGNVCGHRIGRLADELAMLAPSPGQTDADQLLDRIEREVDRLAQMVAEIDWRQLRARQPAR